MNNGQFLISYHTRISLCFIKQSNTVLPKRPAFRYSLFFYTTEDTVQEEKKMSRKGLASNFGAGIPEEFFAIIPFARNPKPVLKSKSFTNLARLNYFISNSAVCDCCLSSFPPLFSLSQLIFLYLAI